MVLLYPPTWQWHNHRMEIETLVLGELQTNCYLVFDTKTRDALIIDPADSGDSITTRILELGLHPVGIVLTHGHFDHVLGLLEVSLNFPVPIYLDPADQFLINTAQNRAEHWLKHPVDPVPNHTQAYPNNRYLWLGDNLLEVKNVPGHTPGSIALYSKNESILFTGDTLFSESVGSSNHRYGNALQLSNSVHDLLSLPHHTQFFAGHGPASTLQETKLKLET